MHALARSSPVIHICGRRGPGSRCMEKGVLLGRHGRVLAARRKVSEYKRGAACGSGLQLRRGVTHLDDRQNKVRARGDHDFACGEAETGEAEVAAVELLGGVGEPAQSAGYEIDDSLDLIALLAAWL